MSGGFFDHAQSTIRSISDRIKDVLDLKSYEHITSKPEVNNQMFVATKLLEASYIYARRIDWLLSGDDGPDEFLERLAKDMMERFYPDQYKEFLKAEMPEAFSIRMCMEAKMAFDLYENGKHCKQLCFSLGEFRSQLRNAKKQFKKEMKNDKI